MVRYLQVQKLMDYHLSPEGGWLAQQFNIEGDVPFGRTAAPLPLHGP
jgi:hypothetical protein